MIYYTTAINYIRFIDPETWWVKHDCNMLDQHFSNLQNHVFKHGLQYKKKERKNNSLFLNHYKLIVNAI